MRPSQSPLSVTCDPIERLPYDLWAECIKFAIVDPTVGPLSYIAVSYRWSRALVSEPSLWTMITLKMGEDQAARIQTFLHLSQNCLLDIVYWDSIDTLRLILEANSPRIRSIELNVWNEELNILISDINYFFPALHEFSAPIGGIPRSFLLSCLNLRIIHSNFDIMNYDLLNPDIEVVYFTGVEAKDIAPLSQQSKYKTLGINFDMTSHFHNREYLSGFRSWATNLPYLSTHLATCLENLLITISSNIFSALFLQVSLLSRLRSLDLNIILEPQEEPINIVSQEGFNHVRDLRILIMTLENNDSDRNPDIVEGILRALVEDKAVEHLEDLWLSSTYAPRNENLVGACLQSAINAQRIVLYISPRTSPSEESISISTPMAKLEVLSVDSLSYLGYINTTNPIGLELTSMGGATPSLQPRKSQFQFQVAHLDDMIDRLATMDPVTQEELLHHCRTIRFGGNFKPHSVIKFEMLTTVDFSSRSLFGGRQIASRDFLDALLQQPETCPYLSTLGMEGYPFWELLFTVMRRRLMTGITPIKSLILPALPCAYILSHITRYLKGDCSVSTASDVDVVISHRHSRSDFTACILCIDAGYMYCGKSGLDAIIDGGSVDPADPPSQDMLTMDFLPDVLYCPCHIWEGWRTLSLKRERGDICCSRHQKRGQRVEITEHGISARWPLTTLDPFIRAATEWIELGRGRSRAV